MKRKINHRKSYGRGGCYYYYGRMGDFDVYNEIECARHSLNLRMLSMLHSVLSEALNGGGDDGNEDE